MKLKCSILISIVLSLFLFAGCTSIGAEPVGLYT